MSEYESCTLAEKIDALELLGATYVDKKRDVVGALQFWQRALSMRYAGSLICDATAAPTTAAAGETRSNGPSASQQPLVKKNVSNSLTPAYGYEREFETFAELDELRSDVDRVRLQAMLIRERILGTNHPDTTYYIRYRGAVYADTGDYDRCISLWNYALEIQQRIWEPLCAITQSSFVSFAELYQFMFTDAYRRLNRNREIGFDDIMDVLQAAVNELKRAIDEGGQAICTHTESKEEYPLHRMMLVCLHLLNLLCKLEGKLSGFDEYRMNWWIYQLIRLKSRGQHQATLLHMACNSNSSTINRYPVCRFPSLNVVQLLIKLGANVHETVKYLY